MIYMYIPITMCIFSALQITVVNYVFISVPIQTNWRYDQHIDYTSCSALRNPSADP